MDNHEFCIYISNLAIKAMLYEVGATPKPGLVDRANTGSHKDMDFFTFIDSTMVLNFSFYKCTMTGINFNKEDYRLLLNEIRPIGIEAEKDMLKATGGINTHKGLIFSLGIIAAACGNIFSRMKNYIIDSKEIIEITKSMSEGLTKELGDVYSKPKLTYGEKLYIKYGTKGIRGEVEAGFPTVLNYSLPHFKELISKGIDHINEIMVDTLIYLIANTEDSNILGRHNMDVLIYAQDRAKEAIDLGGYLTHEGKLYIEKMDRDFIEKNISPGGSADLLAVTLMLYFLEKRQGDIGV